MLFGCIQQLKNNNFIIQNCLHVTGNKLVLKTWGKK